MEDIQISHFQIESGEAGAKRMSSSKSEGLSWKRVNFRLEASYRPEVEEHLIPKREQEGAELDQDSM